MAGLEVALGRGVDDYVTVCTKDDRIRRKHQRTWRNCGGVETEGEQRQGAGELCVGSRIWRRLVAGRPLF